MHNFIKFKNGYKYRLIEDVRCDGNMCTATFEVEKNGKAIKNIEEINQYIPELTSAIMENDFKQKHVVYDLGGCLYYMQNNVYELVFEINSCKDIYKLLKQFCEGKEVILLSGDFKDKKGIYNVEQKGFLIKRIDESTKVDEQTVLLKYSDFKFKDNYIQMTYDEIKNIHKS